MSKYEAPLRLSISLPPDREYNEGSTRRYKEQGRIMAVRYHKNELELISKVATILGISFSALVRHCAVKYSQEILKHREQWIKEQINATKESDPSG